ncbi:MAG: alpha-L-rhamnosidase N-terminal domain-containing protein [bacterium]
MTHLRCEYLVNPLGIDVAKPRLSWVIEDLKSEIRNPNSETRGQKQTAYQILMASSEELLKKDKGDFWDSGKVASDESANLVYGGRPLDSSQYYLWKVRVWDGAGQSSAWSKQASFLTGLRAWQGKWIGATDQDQAGSAVLGFAVEAKSADAVKWVQVDLESSKPIDRVVLHPMRHNDPAGGGWVNGYGFPLRFRLEVSDDADFKTLAAISDQTLADYPNPGWLPVSFEAGSKRGRYVRLTVTKLWHRGAGLPFVYTLGELEVFSAGTNASLKAPVTASDSVEGSGWGKSQLTDGLLVCSAAKGADELVKHPHAAILLRKEIKVAKPVKRAIVAMSGLGWSELSLNGKKVGDAVLSPQFSDYNKRVPYVMYDVTGLLQKDANAIGVILGNGFSATPNLGYLKWYGNGGKPRLLFQMTVEYIDGTRQTVVSDESWKWSTGEITFNDLWVGEHVDARLAQPGWDRTGFNDVEWHPALDVSAPRGKLFARTIPSIRVLETSLPVKIDGDKFIFDAVGAGWLRLKVNGQAGDKVIVNYRAGGYGVSTEYLLKGGGEEVFEPRFLFHTIDRVVTVAGLRQTPTNDTLTRCSAQIDLRRVGSFECSSDFLNRQYEALLRTQRNYNYDYPMDPTREKSGWTQDVMTMINSSVYDFDTAAFYWNWWQDMRLNQRADGYLGSVVPLVDRVLDACNCVWWSGMIVYTPWKLYEYYGDRRFIEESYPAMVSYINWLATKADADKVVAWGLGDWIEVGSISAPQRTSVAITSTCGYYYYATIISQSAALLGKADESAKYARLAEEIKAGFNRRFLNTQTGQVGANPDTQTAQIVPLYFGMVPVEQRQRVLDRLVANIHERKDHVSTGFIGTLYLLLGLPELGQAELTHKMVMQQDYPGWNTMVKDGVQMETWGGGQVQMPSLGGPIGAYLYQVLGGIRPDPKGPGFKRIIIKPAVVGDLTWVKTHHDSPYGRIVSNWQREGDPSTGLRAGKLTMDVTIPANTRATVFVPAKDAAEVSESGKPAAQAQGVKFLRMENGAAVFDVGSGCYRFVVNSATP